MDNDFVPASPQQLHERFKPHRQRARRKVKRSSLPKQSDSLPNDPSASTSFQSHIAASSEHVKHVSYDSNTSDSSTINAEEHELFLKCKQRMQETYSQTLRIRTDIFASVRCMEKANRRTASPQLTISKAEQDRLANLGFIASEHLKENEMVADLFADLQKVQEWNTQWPDQTGAGAESVLKTPPRSCVVIFPTTFQQFQ
jgi:hypothetical protein